MTKTYPALSIVIPLLNEEGNLELLHQKLTEVLGTLGQTYEIIFINDGSTDNSPQILAELFERDPAVQVIHFQQNFGKTAALTAGFRHSQGQVIITLDADLQDDPAEIPAMLNKLEEGYDLVVPGATIATILLTKLGPRAFSIGQYQRLAGYPCTISIAVSKSIAGR